MAELLLDQIHTQIRERVRGEGAPGRVPAGVRMRPPALPCPDGQT
jgi:hypothetical protein